MKKILFLLLAFYSSKAMSNQNTITFISNKEKLKDKVVHWNISITTQSGQKLCYVTSAATSSTNKCSKPRSKAFSTVTYISKSLAEVSVSSGVNYKAPVIAIIDNKHKLSLPIIDGKIAWTQNVEVDRELVTLMQKGNSMVIESSSPECGIIRDRYSLIGFTKAYEKMRYLCNKDTEPTVKFD